MSDNINRWKLAVCETRENYEQVVDAAFDMEPPETDAYIASLICLCNAYECQLSAARDAALEEVALCEDALANQADASAYPLKESADIIGAIYQKDARAHRECAARIRAMKGADQ